MAATTTTTTTTTSPMSSGHRRSPFFSFMILCFSILFSLISSASALTSRSQCLHLLELKKGFAKTNESYHLRDSTLPVWLASTDCCRWEGVTCDEASGLIVSLDLSERWMGGNISSSLFNLTSLQKLNLAFNSFTQRAIMLSSLERLANLTHLNLSYSGIEGQVPVGISRLKKLLSLDLSTHATLDGPSTLKLETPDLRMLIKDQSSLKELYLDGVNVSSMGRQWCRAISKSLPGLEALSLASCSLSGPIDSSLSKLRNLSLLVLKNNPMLVSNVPEYFANYSSLRELRLRSCQLQGLFPRRVFELTNLRVLDLSVNPMLSGYFPEFSTNSSLDTLVISKTNFSGSLPDSLGNLKSLRGLDLSACNFSGPIPRSIWNLSKLVYLYLSDNHFTGEIPPMLGGSTLRHLKRVVLGSNALSGSIPIYLFTLPALELLNLNDNKFSGQLKEFSNASSTLSNLYLDTNNLQGKIPKSILDLSGLEELSLGSNKFDGTVELELFGHLRNLSSLDLSGIDLSISNRIVDSSLLFPSLSELILVSCNLSTIPSFLKHKSFMDTIDLSNNRIAGIIPKWIWNTAYDTLNLSCNLFTVVERPLPDLSLLSLDSLDLHSNMLGGPIPYPPNSYSVDYSHNLFTSFIPFNISYYLDNMIFFSLSNNNLTGEVPSSICSATWLEVLDLSQNKFNGSIPSCLIESHPNLVVLNVWGNHFQGIMPQNISSRCALQTINLRGNKLEGMVPRSLANCVKLEVIDLGSNKFIGSFPYWLVKLPALKVLVLRENKFYGHLTGICKGNHILKMLQIFDISSNRFTGSLPSECFKSMKAMMVHQVEANIIGYDSNISSYYEDTVTVTMKGYVFELVKILTTFTSIDFSNNMFEGSLPEVIGELKSLHVLNLSLNSFTGQIPSKFGNIMELESLDLSGNKLSGIIPSSMTSLYFLAVLNLSNNNLIGRIPQGNQFSTFSNSSFEGNPGLCGYPLSRQCVNSTNVELSSDSMNASPEFDMEEIWIWLFRGLGFGVGFALAIVHQLLIVKLKIWYRRRFMNR